MNLCISEDFLYCLCCKLYLFFNKKGLVSIFLLFIKEIKWFLIVNDSRECLVYFHCVHTEIVHSWMLISAHLLYVYVRLREWKNNSWRSSTGSQPPCLTSGNSIGLHTVLFYELCMSEVSSSSAQSCFYSDIEHSIFLFPFCVNLWVQLAIASLWPAVHACHEIENALLQLVSMLVRREL